MHQNEINKKIKLWDRFMKWFISWYKIKVCIAILIAIAFHSIAEAQNQSETDQLIFSQYSIESRTGSNRSSFQEFDGAITFYFLIGDSEFNSNQFLKWIDDGIVSVDGVIFQTGQAIISGGKKLIIPFKFSTKLIMEYYPTQARLSGNHNFREDITPLSLYPNTNHKVLLTLESEQNENTTIAQSWYTIYPAIINGGYTIPIFQFYALDYIKPEKEKGTGGSFIYRNRFWLIGATTLALSGTTAIIGSTGGSGPVFLPEPPGRP